MNILTILGSIGGVLYLIRFVIFCIKDFSEWYEKYIEMRNFYEKEHEKKTNVKIPMGFKTDEERKEIESKFKS